MSRSGRHRRWLPTGARPVSLGMPVSRRTSAMRTASAFLLLRLRRAAGRPVRTPVTEGHRTGPTGIANLSTSRTRLVTALSRSLPARPTPAPGHPGRGPPRYRSSESVGAVPVRVKGGLRPRLAGFGHRSGALSPRHQEVSSRWPGVPSGHPSGPPPPHVRLHVRRAHGVYEPTDSLSRHCEVLLPHREHPAPRDPLLLGGLLSMGTAVLKDQHRRPVSVWRFAPLTGIYRCRRIGVRASRSLSGSGSGRRHSRSRRCRKGSRCHPGQ